jgi:hypothetical protein
MQEMADHTAPECATVCRIPHNCCDIMYCEIALHYARRTYNIELQPTGHPTLLFMSERGCVVEPYLRPLCTLHVCSIQSLGQKPDDPEWNETYYQLRNHIDDLLYQIDKVGE